MSTAARVTVVLGTRPEAVKLLSVVRELRGDPGFAVRLITTGQHPEMVDQQLAPFGERADVDLGLFRSEQSLNELMARALPPLEAELRSHPADVVLVQGDTVSALAGALCAFQLGAVPRTLIGHVEAGLRSPERLLPFPEEVNRRLISPLADFHLAPTPLARSNLLREGTPDGAIFVTGNTGLDALRLALDQAPPEALSTDVLVTIHRRESWLGTACTPPVAAALFGVIAAAARQFPMLRFVLPLHPNPKVREAAYQAFSPAPANVLLREPIPSYVEFAALLASARAILTDSGGLQEEASALRIPLLVLRENTERPEALTNAHSLVGRDPATFSQRLAEFLRALPARSQAHAEFRPNRVGDGYAAGRIRQAVRHVLGRGPRPDPYTSNDPA